MNCAWQNLMDILPPRIRNRISTDLQNNLLEIRMRIHKRAKLITQTGTVMLSDLVSESDITYTVNAATRYSPWSATTSVNGFITISGGHRIGIAGEVSVADGRVKSFRTITSLSIRVARQFPGIAEELANLEGSIIILGSPGWGKTTLLRDLIYQKSQKMNQCIAVIDERQELFPIIGNQPVFETGENTDVLSGCPKVAGISMALRTLGPQIIAVDEITHPDDCMAIIESGWCGVDVIATAHAKNKYEYMNRAVYRPLVECKLFRTLVILRQDKSWYLERI